MNLKKTAQDALLRANGRGLTLREMFGASAMISHQDQCLEIAGQLESEKIIYKDPNDRYFLRASKFKTREEVSETDEPVGIGKREPYNETMRGPLYEPHSPSGELTVESLREALFSEISDLRAGRSNPSRAIALSKLATTILQSAAVELKYLELQPKLKDGSSLGTMRLGRSLAATSNGGG